MLDAAAGPAVRPDGQPAAAGTAMILSVATNLPGGRLTSAELAERYGVSEEWIVARTGIRERRQAASGERISDYAARAGALALQTARVGPADLGRVSVATMTPDELTPNTAPLVAHELGAARAGALDVGAACTAFLAGLALGAAQVESRRAELVLLVGADFITRITDYEDPRSAPLFADAVGAVVIGAANGAHGAIGPIVLGADGSHAQTIFATHAEGKLRPDGPEVYRNAFAEMGAVTLEAAARAGLSLEDIDLFVYHQANARITRALGERLELPPERVVDCIETLGNASAATIPVALDVAIRQGRLKPGLRVLLSALGAGFTGGGGIA